MPFLIKFIAARDHRARFSSVFLSSGVEGPTKNHSIGGKRRRERFGRDKQRRDRRKEKTGIEGGILTIWRKCGEGASERDRTAAVSSERRRDGDEIKLNRRLRRNGIGRHAGTSELKVGNDRKAFFHFGRYRKGTGRKLSISAGTVMPAETTLPAGTLSFGRKTYFRPKDSFSKKRNLWLNTAG